MRLFNVTTKVREFRGECKDVHLIWIHAEPQGGRPYHELIENYDARDVGGYAESCIDEKFTEDEATQLKAYIDRTSGDEDVTTIAEVELPVPANVMGVGAMPVGGGEDFLMVYERPNYPLPFKVMAYYNLVGCEMIDGSGVYHSRLWVIERDAFGGTKVRQQTNREAAAFAAERSELRELDGRA